MTVNIGTTKYQKPFLSLPFINGVDDGATIRRIYLLFFLCSYVYTLTYILFFRININMLNVHL